MHSPCQYRWVGRFSMHVVSVVVMAPAALAVTTSHTVVKSLTSVASAVVTPTHLTPSSGNNVLASSLHLQP